MRYSSLEYLRCPVCVGNLEIKPERTPEVKAIEGTLRCLGCGRTYPIRGGIPDLAYPDELLESDLKVLEFYEGFAEQYDHSAQAIAEQLRVDEDILRNWKTSVVERLRLRPGKVVLDVSCGTGADLIAMSGMMGGEGLIVGVAFQWRCSGWLGGSSTS